MARHTTTTGDRSTGRRASHHPIILTLLFIVSAVELGLLSHLVYLINHRNVSFVPAVRRRFKYALFCAVWTTLLSLVLLGVSLATKFFRWMHHTIFLILTTIFWLIAAALIESRVGDFNDRSDVCHSYLGATHCKEIKVIRALAWALFALSLLSIPVVWFLRRKEHHEERHHTATTAAPMTQYPAGTTATAGNHTV